MERPRLSNLLKNIVSGKGLYVSGGLLIVVGVTAGYLLAFGYYPVALVGNKFITANTFYQNYRAAALYSQQVDKVNAQLPQAADASTTTSLTPDQLRVGVMDQLVQSVIINQALTQELSKGEISTLIDQKVSKYDQSASLRQAAAGLFGFTYADFKSKVLVPQAERDILTGRIYLKGQNFPDWFAEKKKATRVALFAGGFAWDGEHVVAK